MNFLFLDTSGPDSFVAHSSDGNLEVIPLPPGKQSQTLHNAIERLLPQKPLNFIAVGIGPGAFTGTRVGVMGAKALAYALKIPLIPFYSLKRYTPDQMGPFALYEDGKSRGFYLLEGEKTPDGAIFQKPRLSPTGNLTPRPLNLPFLARHLETKFREDGGLSHDQISPLYLGNL